jgi:PAS domain S-box-containing protein
VFLTVNLENVSMTSVLIIDDEPEVQVMLSLMLNGEGFVARRAGSGAEAIEAYREQPADVVLTDLRMPEMDGIQLIHELQKIDKHVAVVVLTGFGELENAVELMHGAGVYNYLTKPLETPEVLIAAIRSAREKRRLTLENQRLITGLKQANEALEEQVADRTGAMVASNRQLSLQLRRRRLSEQALQQERETLERRIEERTQKLAEINRRLNMEVVQRRRSEEALRCSRREMQIKTRELELFYRAAPVGLCLLDHDGRVIKANPTMAEITGRSHEAVIDQPLDSVCPGLAKALSPVIRQITSTGKPIPSHIITLPGTHDTSRLSHWLVSSYPLMLDEETRMATSHIFQDISEQRQAQELIRNSKTMLQAVFDGIQDMLIMVDRQMVVRMINHAAKTYYRIDAYSDVIGKKCSDIICGHDHCETCRIPQLVASGRSATFERPVIIGDNRLERVAVYPLCKSEGKLDGAIIQISDITETKGLERQLFHSEKLASLGLLASGVAHEINNPNGFITFNLPILRNYMSVVMAYIADGRDSGKDKTWFGMSFDAFHTDLFELIDNMEHGAQRISQIVNSMNTLAQSKPSESTVRKCRLHQIIEHVETLCSGELKRVGQHLSVDCPADLPEMMLDSGALEQVLINLLMNAAQATDKADAWIRLSVERTQNDRLAIIIQDNGCGMDENVRQKLFDPFFTTKAPGSGTGLGMAVCHNLVTSIGGTIQVESEVNKGSTFRIDLPVAFSDGAEAGGSRAIPHNDSTEPVARSA